LGCQADGTYETVVGVLQSNPRIDVVFGDGMVLAEQIPSIQEVVGCCDIMLFEKPIS
jgi:hypothetical protein